MRYITFKDFIEAVAIRELRTEFGIPLPKIREAVLEARSRYKIEYPFSDKTRQTKTDGQELHIFLNDNQQIIQISGKQKRQASLQTVVVPFMKALIYDERGIGYEYVAADYGFTKITLNPGVMFGSPRVKDSPFSALTLWRAKNAEGDIDKVAELYKLNPRTVSASCKYCEENLRLAA